MALGAHTIKAGWLRLPHGLPAKSIVSDGSEQGGKKQLTVEALLHVSGMVFTVFNKGESGFSLRKSCI